MLPEGVTLEDYLDSKLDDMLALDVARAAALSRIDPDDTFVHDWKEEVSE